MDKACEEAMDTQTNHFITGDPAFAVDRHDVIVLWNEAAEKSFGVPVSKALGKKCWDLLSGKDAYDNRYCCRHCPIREMGFLHEPVHGFQSTFKTGPGETEQFSVSCVTVYDEPGSEMLLHICHSDNQPMTPANNQLVTSNHPGELSEREIEILALLADKVRTKDIASTLSISIRTVRTHIQHVMYKLQVHKRSEAIQLGKRLKLI